MRVVLVGRPGERARLRAGLDGERFEIVGEFDALADARAAAVRADAVVIAAPARGAASGRQNVRAIYRENEERIDEPLTARETEVLELLAEGLPNKAIASRLGISDQTVKFHVASIIGKLGASNRTDAVRLALRRGLISL
jgi:DNA-binding NarL/FixJ family response regulator